MYKLRKLIALAAVMALFGSQLQGQEGCDSCVSDSCVSDTCCDDSPAYCDSGRASYLSAALPIGALAVAAIIIATTDNDHHHSSSNNSRHAHHHHHHHH